MNNEDICILIPTLNEGKTIAGLVREFKSIGYPDILVIDGHSMDDTVSKAQNAGARVVLQSGTGKGQAISQAFHLLSSKYIVMIDGDGTYLPEEINKLIEPVISGQADHVIGNRFTNYQTGAFTGLNLLGNKILNKIFGFAYGVWLNDILSGYRAFNYNSYKQIELNRTGFEVETEITVECVKKDLKIVEVPITYLARVSGAATKLRPVRDGLRIASTIYLLARTHNPLFYFNLIGGFLTLLGVIVGIYVVDEWIKNVTHVPLTILATLLIVTGILMFIFAILSDLIVSMHRENMHMMRKILKEKDKT
ncbi:dolichol-phosphate mannosyltransferase [Methanosarcinales archaeon]|uniref:S-layer glycoprotein N-glycosyltransferase AglJ n=1 Tax=Candidatus Methanoperedens sp. BLZ2 TaxID=2035255 RepID=UPI000BE3D1DC|nr:S-layer glycoprotein N-glycosyltransferase AglJ [Candidatus Methanoperedens sp. BLZ2]KAB2943393.1 MAG: S-layer glycoprotein N-glycosyltransferase AglJ [Candidatus Methanoperedens sp.]MBZ0173854.1 S-layer glycoprotein N-glycosyltransferase AglJ [Candidatus Methanoperedens nitroreducens]CAG1004129.1 dolichol-phosphate mannosyltransferase [Methanosarcinales archaeon]MCX9077650.1 S-layer glycoprotein N-glycosyltransferase AglJ [Candidatus Methanoperedens sp.]MCX9086875.1 S-layer glycoprotein N-